MEVVPAVQGRPANYLIAAAALAVGLLLGFLFANFLVGPKPTPAPPPQEVTLPPDAVRVQSCANNKGTLYAKPADIPGGPVYLVNNGKVIGIEFMIGRDDLLGGKNFKALPGLDLKLNHTNIGFLSQGHEGNAIPHYHFDLYSVSAEVEQAITCPTP